MKVATNLLAFICPVIILASCGGKDKKEGGKEDGGSKKEKQTGLTGDWEVRRATGSSSPSMDSMNLGTVYHFNGDTLMMSQGSFKNPGLTTITDSTFTFQAIGNELKFGYHYKIAGDTLVVVMDGSGGQTMYMVRK